MGGLANFVSMHINTMTEYKGVLEFEYLGRTLKIPYTMNNLGGDPHVYIRDKNGRHHSFAYLYGKTWYYGCNRGPNWPKDFIDVLFACFELARQKHGLG